MRTRPKQDEAVDLLDLLIEQVVDYAIFALDPAGNIASWNAGAERIKGYAPHEIIGKPYAVFFTEDFVELYRYIEYPAIYGKERIIGHLRAARPGETPEQTAARGGAEIGDLLESPFYDVWAQGAIAEILSALHERVLIR